MDALAPLLRAFYTEPLSTEARTNIHRSLISNLTDQAYQAAAIQHISDLVCHPRPVDPFLLHHSLLIIETLVRTSFLSIPQSDRSALYTLLLKLLTHAHITHLSDYPLSQRIPSHAVNKAAAALVTLSKRLWLSGLSDFPSTLFRLIDSPAHTTESLASLLAGHAILTTLLDDLVSARHDLLACDTTRLRRSVSDHASHFLAALEVALRAAGPRFPSHVSLTAARAVSTLVKLELSVASHATALLSRSVLNRYDNVAAHIFTSVADILSTPAFIVCTPVVDAVVAALDVIVTAPDNLEVNSQVPPALFAVLDPLVSRLLSTDATTSALNAVLNGLMGVTMRWASHSPHLLPRALDMWVSVLDSFDDAEKGGDPLLLRVYDSVISLCAERAFFATNADVLRRLDGCPTDLREHNLTPPSVAWDAAAEKMADVASNPSGPSAPALFFENTGDANVVYEGDGDDELGDTDGWEGCSVSVYTGKCVEVIAVIVRMDQARSAGIAVLVGHILSQCGLQVNETGMPSIGDEQKEKILDAFTAFSLAYALVGTVRPSTVEAHTVCEAVTAALSSGVWKMGRAGVMGLRASAALLPCIIQDGRSGRNDRSIELSQWAIRVLPTLMKVGLDILAWSNGPERTLTAGALLCVTLDDVCKGTLFLDGPPVPPDVVAKSSSIGVSCLGAGAMVRWAIVPGRDFRGVRVRWSDTEWNARETKLGQMCELVFGPLGMAASAGEDVASTQGLRIVGRLIGLLHTVVLSIHSVHGRTADVVWRCAGRSGVLQIVRIVHALASVLLKNEDKLDDESRKACGNVISASLNCIGAMALTCSLQLARDGKESLREAIHASISVTQNGTSVALKVAYAVMKLIRDRVACGESEFVLPGLEMAANILRSAPDGEVVEVGVSLITEGIKRHWLMFWPEDKVTASQGSENMDRFKSPSTSVMEKKGEEARGVDERIRRCYFKSLECLIEVVRSRELGVCRSGLLALQQLNASRRLYRREQAFQSVGCGEMVATECIHIVGGSGDASRKSLSDEAIEVLWGIASVEIRVFISDLPNMVREVGKKGGSTLDDGMISNVVRLFDGADNRISFGRAVSAMANDLMYFSNLIPSL